jgi:hypothetical protein
MNEGTAESLATGTARYADLISGSPAEDRTPPVPVSTAGTVDVHKRAEALLSQGHSRWEAYRQATAEVKRYRQYARCDRCGVLRGEVHSVKNHAGLYLAVCGYCSG